MSRRERSGFVDEDSVTCSTKSSPTNAACCSPRRYVATILPNSWRRRVVAVRYLLLRRHCVRAAPEVHGPEMFLPACLKVHEQLRAIRGMTAEHQADDEGAL